MQRLLRQQKSLFEVTHMIIPIANQHSYYSIPRNQDLKLTVPYKCNAPSRQLVIDWKGDCFVCGCEAWLPVTVGNIDSFDSLANVWTSNTAQALQADIDSGAFSHCAVDRCGVMYQDKLDSHHVVSINVDESCNLACPSCRPHNIMMSEGTEFDRKLAQVQHIRKLLEQFEEPCHIVMSGNGDPLASAVMRPLIKQFRPNPNQTIRLFTNGLLMEKQLSDSPILNHITQYFISIDAGSAEVYHDVRRPGRWSVLMHNLEWLRSVQQQTGAEVLLKFVLQQANHKDIQNFCQLCINFGFNGVVNRLEDWGTWSDFAAQDAVGNIAHQDHAAAIKNLRTAHDLYADQIQFNASLVELCKPRK
jgi:molybdenum cofactor biosynthesis enzyme MoaA